MNDSRVTTPVDDGLPMGPLRAAVAEASALLSRLASVRPGPPSTSQDRRRNAVEAGLRVAALGEACEELDLWLARQHLDAAALPSGSPAAAHIEASEDDQAQDGGAGPAETDEECLAIAAAQAGLDEARTHLDETVAEVRARGASWRRIGEALGIAGQTAHKRFDPDARRRHADYMRLRNQRLAGR